MIQHWDGLEWTIVPSPNGAGGYISELNTVAAVTPTNIWAAGQAFDGSSTSRRSSRSSAATKWTRSRRSTR